MSGPSPASFDSLPTEILRPIFERVDRELCNCLTLNRRLHELVLDVLYAQIALIGQQIGTFMDAHSQIPHLAARLSRIRELSLSWGEGWEKRIARLYQICWLLGRARPQKLSITLNEYSLSQHPWSAEHQAQMVAVFQQQSLSDLHISYKPDVSISNVMDLVRNSSDSLHSLTIENMEETLEHERTASMFKHPEQHPPHSSFPILRNLRRLKIGGLTTNNFAVPNGPHRSFFSARVMPNLTILYLSQLSDTTGEADEVHIGTGYLLEQHGHRLRTLVLQRDLFLDSSAYLSSEFVGLLPALRTLELPDLHAIRIQTYPSSLGYLIFTYCARTESADLIDAINKGLMPQRLRSITIRHWVRRSSEDESEDSEEDDFEESDDGSEDSEEHDDYDPAGRDSRSFNMPSEDVELVRLRRTCVAVGIELLVEEILS